MNLIIVALFSRFFGLYDSYIGLTMAGYQGWFNCEGDGAGRGFGHYGNFDPNSGNPGASVDGWPYTVEYPIVYPTAFLFENDTVANVYSAYNNESQDLHFKWMQQYNLDGVFLQRFVGEISGSSGKNQNDHVMKGAFAASTKYNRAVAAMYDLSGMGGGGVDVLLNDARDIMANYSLLERQQVPNYLFHDGKPLITVWGVGFNDNRNYGYNEANRVVDGLHELGYSVMLGVPTYWRTLDLDTLPDPELHNIIKKCEIFMPWLTGRFNMVGLPKIQENLLLDIQWAKENGVLFVPLVFPGFCWKNQQPSFDCIERGSGDFIWKQMSFFIKNGIQAIYLAMFDEINEGTAILKQALQRNTPTKNNKGGRQWFWGLEDNVQEDYYLWLVGEMNAMLHGDTPLTDEKPIRPLATALPHGGRNLGE